MILLRSHIAGFGRLKELSLSFQSGLNLVYAENEGGKSTLQRFLIGLLYGQLRSDLKVQRRLDSWVDQYKPWRGPEYGGILWCSLSDGRELEIHRSFGKDETRVEIRASTGEDITDKYEQQRNGDVLFAQFHLGLPKELYESVGMIRENMVAEIYGYETIRDRISNLAQSGDEDLSVRRSLAKIQENLDSIGSERAPTKPYKQAQELVQSLQSERKVLDERRAQFQSWIEDRNRVAGEISKLEREVLRTQRALLLARRREAAARVQSLEEIDADRSALRAEIDSLGARADFPVDRLDELNQLVGARESVAKHLGEIRAEKEAALSQLSKAEAERQELSSYASFAASSEAEKITEWFVSYLSISLQKDGLQKTVSRLQSETGGVEKRLSELSPALMDPEADWQRAAREAAEDEQNASQNGAVLTVRINREKSELSAVSRSALNRRILAAMSFIVAAAPAALRSLSGLNLFPIKVDIGVGLGFVIVAIILLLIASKSARAGQVAKQTLRSLESELNTIRNEGGIKRKRINEVMADSGFHKLDDFLVAAKQAEQGRQKLADLQARLVESEQQRQRLEAQSAELYLSLKDGLAKAGLSCSPGSLKFQIDVLRANLRRFRDLDANCGSCTQSVESLKSREAELAQEHQSKCSGIQSLLDLAHVDSPEQFREDCMKRQKLMELLEKESSRTREFQRLAGSLTLPEWKDKLQDIMEQPLPQDPLEFNGEAPSAGAENSAPFLPYQPTIPEAEEQERKLAAQLSSAREDYARAVERINQAFQSYRSSSEIEEDLALAEENFRELEINRLALGIAHETIEKLSRQQQEVLAPQLNAAVEQRFLRLCGRRYEEVKIDTDFRVWVREIENGELRAAEHLSRGTQDQLYFSMRFGILDLVSNDSETCPCLLDEPFAAYDRIRMAEAFEVLAEEARRRQLFLFTCREDLVELARQHHAHIVRLVK